MEIYLDNAATTKIFDSVKDTMIEVYEKDYGNPSSKHSKGMEAENRIKQAAEIISKSLKGLPKDIIFTSGGTESNNMALIGTSLANRRLGNHIITTEVEHPSVHEPLLWLEQNGFEVTYLPVEENGYIKAERLTQAITDKTIVVSMMYVNNEIGSVLDVETLCKAAKQKKKNIIFHTDAIQAYGKYQINPKKWGIDLLSASAHKIHGPKGIGFLYRNEQVKISPILYGGGQQKGLRSGTENVPGIAGMGCAVKEMYTNHFDKMEHLYQLKEYFICELKKLDNIIINGIKNLDIRETAPHIISVSFEGIRSEVLLHALADKGVFISSGSACASNHPDFSNTLKAIGVSKELLDSTLRFSTSVNSTKKEIDNTINSLRELIPILRKYTRH